MVMDQYRSIFISEAKDHLDSLNQSLLGLEKDPDNKDMINQAFRSFHTLKGNAAMIGLKKFTDLAHDLESVLGKVRNNELKINRVITDLLLEGVDLLEQEIEALSKGDSEKIQIDVILGDLKKIIISEDKATDVSVAEKASLSPEEQKLVAQAKSSSQNVFRVVLVMDVAAQMKTAKVLIFLKKLDAIAKTIHINPSLDDLKKGKMNTDVEIVVSTQKAKDQVLALANSVSNLKHAFVMDLEESYGKPQETVVVEKEHAKEEIATKHQSDAVKQIQAVKVDMDRLDALMNLVGEMLISNIRLQDINKKKDYHQLDALVAGIDRLILNLQDRVHDIRMVPISNILSRFPRMVRDLAEQESKQVELVIEGSEIEFDRTVLDQIGEPLVHMLRNSVDHGIELPAERTAIKKPEKGTIKIIVKREKNHATVEVNDDGRGIDPQLVKRSCIKKGIVTEHDAAMMSDSELQMLVFHPGASTNEVVTEVSGRGVGMDVVINKAKELGGTVILNSKVGTGTSITLKLPLTVAIISAMLVNVGKEIYAIPLVNIEQIVDIKASELGTIKGSLVYVHRGKPIPIFKLHDLIQHRGVQQDKEEMTILIVMQGNTTIGIVVDSVIAQQPILIKSLQDIVKGLRGCAGATILGDGSVALILDIETLLG